MFSLSTFFWSFWRGFLFAIPIGPVALLCIQTVIAEGFLAGVVYGIGVACADAIFSSLAVCSIGVLTGFIEQTSVFIKLLGGLFLLVIGYRITQLRIRLDKNNEEIPQHPIRILMTAFLLTILNPLNALFYLGIFSGWGCTPDISTGLMLVIGVISGALLWWTILSLIIFCIKHRLSYRFLKIINIVFGIALAAVGAFFMLQTLCLLFL